MISGQPFDLNVVVIGNVSAGKSTLLNALLRAKYSEVSMKRTTAGINYFRLHTATENENEADSKQGNQEKVLGESELNAPLSEWVKSVDNPRTAASTLQEISDDNARLRTNNDLQEKYFDVEIDESFCPMAHPGVRLVLVDVPGINEADTGSKYKRYLATKWLSFDCIIVVMDGKQGVNTYDQVDLLKFVKANQAKRWQPVIILCNKVDDPDDEEQSELVVEARKEVERIFKVSDRADAMIDLLNLEGLEAKSFLPAFLPFSASHAYFHQTASLLSYEEFKRYDDRALVDKYGKEYVGRAKWNELIPDHKLEAVYAVVTDPKMRQNGLEISSFDRLLKVFSRCIGDSDTQIDLVADKLNVCLSVAKLVGTAWVAELYQSYKLLADCRKSEEILLTGVDLIVKELDSRIDAISVGPKVVADKLADLYNAYQFLAESQANDAILSRAVGLIVDRLNAAVACVSARPARITKQLMCLHKWCKFLAESRDVEILSSAESIIAARFWQQLRCSQEEAVSSITKSPHGVECWSPVVSEILAYHAFAKTFTVSQKLVEETNIERSVRDLVQTYLRTLISQANAYQENIEQPTDDDDSCDQDYCEGTQRKKRKTEPTVEIEDPWERLTPEDWMKIWGSVLLVASNPHFYEKFGPEKMEMDNLLDGARRLRERYQRAISAECGCSLSGSDPSSVLVTLPENKGHTRICSNCGTIPVLFPRGVSPKCFKCSSTVDDSTGICLKEGCSYLHRKWKGALFFCSSCRALSSSIRCEKCTGRWLTQVKYYWCYGEAISVPEALSDPSHFGHVIWRYCNYMSYKTSLKPMSKKLI
jgi:small GTP-binding protein